MRDLFVKYKTRLQKSFYPTPLWSYFIFIFLVLILNSRNDSRITWTITVGTFLWIRLCIAIRLLLTLILRHKGFIFETRGKDLTLKTKIYRKILRGEHVNYVIMS